MEDPTVPPEQVDIAKELADRAYPTTNTTPELQQHYLKQYSFAALVMNYFYYRAMKDKLFMWLGLLASLTVFLLPLLFILPFWARQRAYTSRTWQNFGEFESAQKKWDEISVYSLIGMLIVAYLLIRFLLPVYEQGLQQLGVSTTADSTQQINQATDNFQQTVGP